MPDGVPALDTQHQAIGQSEAFLDLQERISMAARTSRPVIFIGERGTGKELAAARLHMLSARWSQPYVTLNCAALSPTLIESELFGHEAGAFTGAMRQRKGRFEIADGGSLFLDEVANIPPPVQEKILRVVEYGQMERVGSSAALFVNVRLIAATHADLQAMARAGQFRQDLLDRLSFEVITLPPLRARVEDIILLAEHFARRMASELGYETAPEIADRAKKMLLAYPWPGNVRELKNVIERMVYRSGGEPIEEIVFDPFESEWGREIKKISPEGGTPEPHTPPEGGTANMSLVDEVAALELRRIREALEACRFNQKQAAERLGLTYHQFRGYYKKYKERLGV
ncbi:MAG: phage shock protein operon transcriptional activator [Candidatus Sumerlaeia bacterium]